MQVKWIRHTRVTCCRCPFCHICIKIWRIRRLRLENSVNSPFFQKLMAKKRKFQVKWIRNIQISYSQHPSCHILSKCEDIAASASKIGLIRRFYTFFSTTKGGNMKILGKCTFEYHILDTHLATILGLTHKCSPCFPKNFL